MSDQPGSRTAPLGPNLPIIHDSAAAEARSLMHKQKVFCNGEATGIPCQHYWAVRRIVSSQNADFLTQGEKLRFCRNWGMEPLEFDDGRQGQMNYCTEYEPNAKGRTYDAAFEAYNPISQEQLDGLTDPTHAPVSDDSAEEEAPSPPQFKSGIVSITDVLAEEAKEADSTND